jgi:hypothetical protein
MTLRPPACPRLDPANPYLPTLEWFWPEWLRITTHLAIVRPETLDALAEDLVGDSPLAISSALCRIGETWKALYLQDFWALCQEVAGSGLAGRELPKWDPEDKDRDPPRVSSLLPEVGDVEGLLALSRAFVWRKGTGSDHWGGWLESRWVYWPSTGTPRLSLHLSHPSTGHVHPGFALRPLPRPRIIPSRRSSEGLETEVSPYPVPDPLKLNGG